MIHKLTSAGGTAPLQRLISSLKLLGNSTLPAYYYVYPQKSLFWWSCSPPLNDYKGVPFGLSLWATAHMHEKAEQSSTYWYSWLMSLKKVNTFPTLPESLTLALSTSSPLLSFQTPEAQWSAPSSLLAAAQPWFPYTGSSAIHAPVYVWAHVTVGRGRWAETEGEKLQFSVLPFSSAPQPGNLIWAVPSRVPGTDTGLVPHMCAQHMDHSKPSAGRQMAWSRLYDTGEEQEAPSNPVNAGSPWMVFPPFGTTRLGSLSVPWHWGRADGFPSQLHAWIGSLSDWQHGSTEETQVRQAIFIRDIALHTLRGSCYRQVLAFKVHQPGQEEWGGLPRSHS